MDPITQTPSPAQAPQPATKDGGPALASDYETFLQMLTVQMKNQDPLNPADPTELAVQLATFSSVEQQVQTNTLLKGLEAQLSAMSIGQMANWIGMEALTTTPARFDGAPVSLVVPPNVAADRAELVVQDEAGTPLQRLAIDPDAPRTIWAGVGQDGAPFPPGLYTFSVEHFAAGSTIGTAPVSHYAKVAEARLKGSEATVMLDNGVEVRSDEIQGLAAPRD